MIRRRINTEIRTGRKWIVMAITLLVASSLTACGSTSESYTEETSMEAAPAYEGDAAVYDEMAVAPQENAEVSKEATAVEGTTGGEVTSPGVGRKLIKNVDLSVETQEFDALISNVRTKIGALDGYIESMSIGENGYSAEDTTRYANVTARIPSKNLEQFVQNVEKISNLISKNESVQDVTLQYVDLESHKKMLLTEQDSLLRLLEKAETIEEIITIESRLSEVRYQIESMESQIRVYDNQIDYSTVYLYVTEVERLTPPEEKAVGDRIRIGFFENVYKVQDGLKEFGIWFVINIPYLVLFLIVLLVLLVIIGMIAKKERKRAEKRKKAQIVESDYAKKYQDNLNQQTLQSKGYNQEVQAEEKKSEENK